VKGKQDSYYKNLKGSAVAFSSVFICGHELNNFIELSCGFILFGWVFLVRGGGT